MNSWTRVFGSTPGGGFRRIDDCRFARLDIRGGHCRVGRCKIRARLLGRRILGYLALADAGV